MAWKPIDEAALHEKINAASQRMSISEKRFWEAIRIEPNKWSLSPIGDKGGGFWAVALIGQFVIWYNDIEDGFNFSRYKKYEMIGDYWCNQDDLEVSIRRLMILMQEGSMPHWIEK